ncbi:hypothetical protein DDE82_003276 [Stemphylium lycopersici]|nr:hypothetical protein DDE82_003276 [Stemphylium lycopersici]
MSKIKHLHRRIRQEIYGIHYRQKNIQEATQTKQSLGGISGRYFNPQLIAESGSLAPLAARYGLVEWAIQSVSRVGLSLKEQIARHNAHLGLIGKEPPYNLDANMLEWIYQCAQISWTSDTDIDIVVCETSPVRAASQSFWSWAGVTWAIQKDEIDFRSNLEMLHGLEHLKANLIWLERDVSSNDEGGMVLARSRSAQLRDGDFIRNYNITDEEWGSQWRQQDWSIVPDSE